MLSGGAANTNFSLQLDRTWIQTHVTIYHTRTEHVYHYTTPAVLIMSKKLTPDYIFQNMCKPVMVVFVSLTNLHCFSPVQAVIDMYFFSLYRRVIYSCITET